MEEGDEESSSSDEVDTQEFPYDPPSFNAQREGDTRIGGPMRHDRQKPLAQNPYPARTSPQPKLSRQQYGIGRMTMGVEIPRTFKPPQSVAGSAAGPAAQSTRRLGLSRRAYPVVPAASDIGYLGPSRRPERRAEPDNDDNTREPPQRNVSERLGRKENLVAGPAQPDNDGNKREILSRWSARREEPEAGPAPASDNDEGADMEQFWGTRYVDEKSKPKGTSKRPDVPRSSAVPPIRMPGAAAGPAEALLVPRYPDGMPSSREGQQPRFSGSTRIRPGVYVPPAAGFVRDVPIRATPLSVPRAFVPGPVITTGPVPAAMHQAAVHALGVQLIIPHDRKKITKMIAQRRHNAETLGCTICYHPWKNFFRDPHIASVIVNNGICEPNLPRVAYHNLIMWRSGFNQQPGSINAGPDTPTLNKMYDAQDKTYCAQCRKAWYDLSTARHFMTKINGDWVCTEPKVSFREPK